MAAGCRRESAEQALRGDIASLQAAIESRDAGEMAGFLAEDFVGNDGLDRDGAQRLAAVYFMRNASIGVTPGPLDVEMQGDHATVRSEEHTSELQSLMRISYAVFCLKKKQNIRTHLTQSLQNHTTNTRTHSQESSAQETTRD